MRTILTIPELRDELHHEGDVGLVPTMGAFHEGHLSLFRAARAESATVVVSLFVNPAQFADAAHVDGYPRDEGRDGELAAAEGVDILFAPSADELYPFGFQTWVDVEELSRGLESTFRPGHFRGVATVCLKLFNIVRPRRAYFGQKDAQQFAVLRRMVADLDLDLELRVLPTVRDADGLALSSRNVLLSPQDRARGLTLSRALHAGAAAADPVATAQAALDGLEIDYVAVADFDPPVLAGAVRVGATRLIDNVPLEGAKR
jgi:pantoate--beta-alanine ligase